MVENSQTISKVKKKKLVLGLIYGMVAGLSFSVFAWGLDALALAQAHVSYSWAKFLPGLIICVVAGGMVGLLTIYLHKHGFAVLLWGLLAILFAWLVVWLPLSYAPNLLKSLNPDLANLLKYPEAENILQYRLVSIVTIGLASLIGGLLEINLVEQAMASPYLSSFIVALVVSATIFGLVGSAADQLINVNLREPVQAIDELIQFAADNEGKEVPRELARKMHLSAVNQISALLQEERQLTLIAYDGNFGQVNVLVDFEGIFVNCTAIYSQPTDCVIMEGIP